MINETYSKKELKTSDPSEQFRDFRKDLLNQVEVLENRSQCLSRKDRVMIDLVLNGNCTSTDLSCLTGRSRRGIQHRIQTLLKRLQDPRSQWMSHILDMNAMDLSILRQAFFQGLSIRTIAIQTGLSPYQIRKVLRHIKYRIKQPTQSKPKRKES